jgi:hypothetical protein
MDGGARTSAIVIPQQATARRMATDMRYIFMYGYNCSDGFFGLKRARATCEIV